MADRLEIHPDNPNTRTIAQAIKVLKKGGLLIYPTDTVYSIGCDINNYKAMEKLAKLKGIKLNKAKFSIVCNDLSHLSGFTKQIERSTFKELKNLFPGPYTIILGASKSLPLAYKDHKTVGIRVPDHAVPQAIVEALGNPIVSTSIYSDDETTYLEYIDNPDLIWDKYKNQIDLFLDAGVGGQIPSTVIDYSDGEAILLREGKGFFVA